MSMPPSIKKEIQPFLSQAPVDIQGIAKSLGLHIYQEKMKDGVSGAIVKDESYDTPSGFVIFVNEKEALVRQRFTAAHECGHFVLHQHMIGDGIEDNYMLRSENFSNALEVQANKFAADILMPYELINRLISEGKNSVEALAKELLVSEIAMAIRLGHPT